MNRVSIFTLSLFFGGFFLSSCGSSAPDNSPKSEWVYHDSKGKLVYKKDARGNQIMDFSHAGYMGGGVAFPNVPVKKTVRPPANDADATDIIQAAINDVAIMPLENGFRGAVLLEPGTYYCGRGIQISTSGVVLRGSGSEGRNASIIWMNGAGRYPAININSESAQRGGRTGGEFVDPNNVRTTIADDYVPSGANTFKVASVEGFSVGDIIQVRRHTTKEWVQFMEMHDLVRNGTPQTWLAVGRFSIHIRRIAAIDGVTFTLDVPLSDSYDAKYLGQNAVEIIRVGASEPVIPLSQIGVEHLRIQCAPLEIEYGNAPYAGIRIGGQDCWVDNVRCVETMNTIPITGRRITIRNTHVTHTYDNVGASKPADFSIEGSQIFIDQCSSDGGNTFWVWTNSYDTGPNVLLNSNFTGRSSRIQPHQRWSTGFLVDNCRAPDGFIDFLNRGVAGSGHGWCMGWGVAWNCTAQTFIIQNPPGAANWSIGCIGEHLQVPRNLDVLPVMPNGIFESKGAHVTPRSLYLAQLSDRLGAQALKAIGYAPGSPAALSLENPKMPVPRPMPPTPIDPEFGENLAFLLPVDANRRKSDTDDPCKYSGDKVVDGNYATYWMPDETRISGRSSAFNLEIDINPPQVFNVFTISEPAGITNVRAYKIEGAIDNEYKILAEGTTIGARNTHTFPNATVWKIRLTILQSEGIPAISELTAHYK